MCNNLSHPRWEWDDQGSSSETLDGVTAVGGREVGRIVCSKDTESSSLCLVSCNHATDCGYV